jgi:hypothetical protein
LDREKFLEISASANATIKCMQEIDNEKTSHRVSKLSFQI